MRIAVNAGALRGAGSSFVGRRTIEALAAASSEHVYLAWVPQDWDTVTGENVMVAHRAARGFHRKFLLDQVAVRKGIVSGSADALLTLGDTGTVCPRVPQAVLVQQAYLTVNPRFPGFPVPSLFKAHMQAMHFYFRAALRSVSRFVVQTETMREELSDFWGLSADRIHVVPSAIADSVRGRKWTGSNFERPRLFYPAGGGPHKNHKLLPSVLKSLGKTASIRPELRLTVDASAVQGVVSELDAYGLLGDVVFLGALTHEQLLDELQQASIVILPSRLESFGLPYLEAMAIGCPIVASSIGVAREQCGDAAVYCDPDDPAQWAGALGELLASARQLSGRSAASRSRFLAVDVSWHQVGVSYAQLMEGL